MNDEFYMKMAIDLAVLGEGYVAPNPMVGAVIVKEDTVISTGYHKKYGEFHAERNAINDCKMDMTGATMYVTLEPCCHYGKTPPCTKAIIESGISKVIVGTLDPNQKMAGKGIKILKSHGIEVVLGVLEKDCQSINKVFFHYITTKTPYVVMKYAMTMDGKIATVSGMSQWITGEEARKKVHHDRHKYSAIMVGIGTVIADDPMLTARIENALNPIRIICDTNLRIALNSKIVQTARDVKTIIATNSNNTEKQELLKNMGVEIVIIPKQDNKISLKHLMIKLGEMKIDSILLEGGAELNFSAINAGIVNLLHTYIAPKIFGGNSSKTPIGGDGISNISDAIMLKNSQVIQLGDDLLIESEVVKNCLQEL